MERTVPSPLLLLLLFIMIIIIIIIIIIIVVIIIIIFIIFIFYILYYYHYLLKAYSPVNRTGTSGLFTKLNLNTSRIQYKTCTLYINVKHINTIRKLVPSAMLS